jgi:hypothetical protein
VKIKFKTSQSNTLANFPHRGSWNIAILKVTTNGHPKNNSRCSWPESSAAKRAFDAFNKNYPPNMYKIWMWSILALRLT